MSAPLGATPFWRTVGLLLHAARRRAVGRSQQNRKLLGNKGGDGDSQAVLTLLAYLGVGFLHACGAVVLHAALNASQRLAAEASGRQVVAQRTLDELDRVERAAGQADPARRPRPDISESARRHAFRSEARSWERAEEMLALYHRRGRDAFQALPGAWGFARAGRLEPAAALLGSLLVGGWLLAVMLQGEGLDFDLQRRRHPMWEWLLGHPVDPRAVFLAEMLTPLSANPFFAMAPVFWVGLFWIAYDDLFVGISAGLASGIALAVAAGCGTKAIEIVSFLRLPVRSRGAVLGILAWMGQAAQLALVFAAFGQGIVDAVVARLVEPARLVPAPLLGWALGLGDASPWKGALACWLAALVIVAVAVQVSARATRLGLAGGFGSAVDAPPALSAAGARTWLVRDALYRKELLWLWRDRGALVQVFLVPLTAAAAQLFNFRNMIVHATEAWHWMAGAAVLLGTYFLSALGPRSLLSEGAALWIPLTWPRSLEDLLRAKARLWCVVACLVVFPLLLVTVLRFPAAAHKVALVAVLWVVFAVSLSQKSVTLVTVVRDSGEIEPVPAGRRFAASLGTFTFAVGVLTQRWALACAGVVFSWMTAAAMWQNLRARLPFLFDPWSERLPPPPTVLHGMVALSIAQEVMAIATVILILIAGPDHLWFATSIAYGLTAIAVAWGLTHWLGRRGVRARSLWRWSEEPPGRGRLLAGTLVAVGAGLALGVFGEAYAQFLEQLVRWGLLPPWPTQDVGSGRVWLAVVTVGLAPVAEEYLFRGLLFKSLEREWGFGRAVLGSACFFAIYHPPLAWVPVGLVGGACAVLFRRSRHLAPSVLLHMVYNAVVVGMR